MNTLVAMNTPVAISQMAENISLDALLYMLVIKELPYLFKDGKFYVFGFELDLYKTELAALTSATIPV